MSRVVIRPATPAAVLYVAENLRAEDRQELETVTGVHYLGAVLRAWGWSEESYIAEIDGIPAVFFGVGAGGSVWMVCTNAVRKAALPVLRASRFAVRAFLTRHPLLANMADCRNTLHLRWLKLMGFTFDEVVEVNGHPFQKFHMTRKEDASCAPPQSRS